MHAHEHYARYVLALAMIIRTVALSFFAANVVGHRAAGDRWCSSRVISNRGGERSLPLHPPSPLTLHRSSFFLCLVTFDSPTFALDREKETRHSKKVSTYIAAPFVWEREWRRREEPVIPVTQPRDSMKSNLHCAPPLSAAHTSHLIPIRVRISRWCSRESRQFPLISFSCHLLRGNYLSFWLWVVWTFGKLFMVYPRYCSTKMLLNITREINNKTSAGLSWEQRRHLVQSYNKWQNMRIIDKDK